ncbi:MAG: ComEC/Rec2 family competence protein [Saprospiraceae bacterium]|nr:ComEC/Rec2 family competence protein [Saprospiraceae bacterium]
MFYQPKYPVLLITLPFLAGCLFTSLEILSIRIALPIVMAAIIILVMLSLLAGPIQPFRGLFWSGVIVTSLLMGFQHMQNANAPNGFEKLGSLEHCLISGVVQECHPTPKGQFILLEGQAIHADAGPVIHINHPLQLYVPQREPILAGSSVLCRGNVTRPKPSPEYQEVNWQEIRKLQGLTHIMWVRDARDLVTLPPSVLRQWSNSLRQVLATTIEQHLHPQNAMILKAMLLGLRQGMPNDLKNIFRETGTIHILAISGLHAGIVYLFFIWLLRIPVLALQLRPTLVYLLALGGLWGYALLTGMQPPILRTASLITLIQTGRLLFRETKSLVLLSVIAMGIVLAEPSLFWNTGFQLSFLAVSGLLIFYLPISQKHPGRSKIMHKVWSMISVTLAAQLLIIPLLLYNFHYLPTYFVLGSLLAVPLTGWILSGSLLALFTEQMIGHGAGFLWRATDLLITSLVHSMQFVQKLPYANLGPFHFDQTLILPLTLILALIADFLTRKHSWPTTQLGVILLGFVVILCQPSPDSRVLVESQNHQMVVHFIGNLYCYDWYVNSEAIIPSSGSPVHAAYAKIPRTLGTYFDQEELKKRENLIRFAGKWYAADELADALDPQIPLAATFYSKGYLSGADSSGIARKGYSLATIYEHGYQWIK